MHVRLTWLDYGSTELSIFAGFVFALPADTSAKEAASAAQTVVERIEAAAHRVAQKWPFITGRAVNLEKEGIWAVETDVPLEGRPPLCTRSTVTKPYHVAAGAPAPLSPLSPDSSSTVLPDPVFAHFRHPSTPRTLAEVAKLDQPIVRFHTTTFSDAVSLGISVPHGVFDAIGLGLIVSALDAKLHNREWTPPSLDAGETGAAALEKLLADEDEPEVKAALPPVLEAWIPSKWLGSIARLISSVLYENLWHRSKNRYLFLPKRAVDKLVERVKQEVRDETGGKEWVSTGDVLLWWSAHADEAACSTAISGTAMFSCRDLLSALVSPTALQPYPHNCFGRYPVTLSALSLPALSSTPLSALALAHRRTVDRIRTLPFLRATLGAEKAMSKGGKEVLFPKRDWPEPLHALPGLGPQGATHVHRWNVTNQLVSEVAALSVPHPGVEGKDLPRLAFHVVMVNLVDVDHLLAFQQSKEGYWVAVSTRESRWKSVMRAVEELEREGWGL